MSARILAVDDDAVIGKLVTAVLEPDLSVTYTESPEDALRRAFDDGPFDLILLDVDMPEMTGHDLCRLFKRDPRTRDIPVIFLTGRKELRDEKYGFEIGAVDYITKPLSPAILRARIHNHIELKSAREQLKASNQRLEEKVQSRTRELHLTRDLTIMSLATLAEIRDDETGNHIRRTQNYIRMLATHLSVNSPYERELDPEAIDLLYKSAPLHDIGKVGVPDAILKKPGRLTPDELAIMRRHPEIGRKAFADAEALLGHTSFLDVAKQIAHGHHEKWDGTGYPLGLKGLDIPLPARLMALADVYDALVSPRCYKPALSHEEAVEIIRENRGSHFDPVIADAFLDIHEQFRAIGHLFNDAA